MLPARFHPYLCLSLILVVAACAFMASDEPDHVNPPGDRGSVEQRNAIRNAALNASVVLDSGRYEEAWQSAAPTMQKTTSRQEFATRVRQLRRVAGPLHKREIMDYDFRTNPPDMLPGNYGIIGFRTDFSVLDGVEEKFVFQHISGQWKLAGYFLSR